MGQGFDKQPASRTVKFQNITYAGGAGGGAAVVTAPFGPAIQHIRVTSSLAGYGSVDQSTSATAVTSANMPSGMIIPANTIGGEYFIVTPGQIFTFCSTSTSSGYVSVTEMA
jgi:hypothetical protein